NEDENLSSGWTGFRTRSALGNGETSRILAASAHIPRTWPASPQPPCVGPPLHPWLRRQQRSVPPWPAGPAQLPYAAAQPHPVRARNAHDGSLRAADFALLLFGDFRSSAVPLRLSAVGLLQFVFHCVRPARLSPRRSSTCSL